MHPTRTETLQAPRPSRDGLRRLAAPLRDVLIAGLALGTVAFTLLVFGPDNDLGLDFQQVAPEIRGLIHGTSPYVAEGMQEGGHYLWSILAGWLLLPLAWLPGGWLVVSVLGLVLVPVSLRLLDVSDWRRAALVVAWPASWYGFRMANITMLVVVLIALGWHERGRTRGGLWLGLAVAVKLFAWPVLVWLAVTRRWRALAVAAAVQVVGLLATLPYISLVDFARYEREADRVFGDEALTLNTLLLRWDVPGARAIAVAVGLAVLWRGRRDLGWCVVAALLLSPIVWLHYYALLLVPFALWAPPLAVWLAPLALWVAPAAGDASQWRLAVTLVVLGLCLALAARSRRGRNVRFRAQLPGAA